MYGGAINPTLKITKNNTNYELLYVILALDFFYPLKFKTSILLLKRCIDNIWLLYILNVFSKTTGSMKHIV